MESPRSYSVSELERNAEENQDRERTLFVDDQSINTIIDGELKGINVGTGQAQAQSLEPLIDLTKMVATYLEEISQHVREHKRTSALKTFEVEEDIFEGMGMVAKTSLEGIKSGSVIAIFLAALDVALLTYAHELVNPDDPDDPKTSPTKKVQFAVGVAIGCFFLSLFYSLFVVVVGSTLAYAHYTAMSRIVETSRQSIKRTVSLVRKGNEMKYVYGGGVSVTLKPDILEVADDEELKAKVFSSSRCVFEQCARMIVAGTWPSLIWLFVGLFVLIWAEHSIPTCIATTIVSVFFLFELAIYHLRDFDFTAVLASSGICIRWFGAVAVPSIVSATREAHRWARNVMRGLTARRYESVSS